MRKALDEVPDGKLFSVGLRQASGPDPVWRTEVAAKDGTVHLVRVDATLGRLLSTAVPADQPPGEKTRTAALVEAAKVLPEGQRDAAQ
ncbi:PepSY domain-containing protein [Streptomyces sp. UG1]|uniref:PepSY domain-containing protein n=1 Tax=Streptomyces sp. UG1 TaxID=3417652 RepID=UPI003CF6E393